VVENVICRKDHTFYDFTAPFETSAVKCRNGCDSECYKRGSLLVISVLIFRILKPMNLMTLYNFVVEEGPLNKHITKLSFVLLEIGKTRYFVPPPHTHTHNTLNRFCQ
jgi:hypothetical protein